MSEHEIHLANILSAIEYEFPDFKIVDKRESKLMRLLSKLLFFNKNFMSRYITVIGNTVYVPTKDWIKEDAYRSLSVFCHEWVHMKDNRRLGPFFKLLYLSPQIFSLLAVLGFWNPLWFLFLICLLPVPSPTRSELEMRGYAVTMAVNWWLLERKPNYDWYSKQFTSSSYYWMDPFKKDVLKDLQKEFDRIQKQELRDHEKQILEILIGEP